MPPRTARSSEEKGGSTRSRTTGRSRETVAHHRKRSALRGSDHSPEVMASARAEATTCIRGEVPFRLSEKAVPGGLRSPGHRRETAASAVALVFMNRGNAPTLIEGDGNSKKKTTPDDAPGSWRFGSAAHTVPRPALACRLPPPPSRRAVCLRVLSRDQLRNATGPLLPFAS